MDHTYWHRQTAQKPLFPDLLWSRPEHKAQAGKLGIIGGNAFGFAAAATAHAEASLAGVGTARVLLPDSLQRTVGRVFEAGEYAPSTPSGSFSQHGFGEVAELSQWADGLLLAGDVGHNSETAILLEKLAKDYRGQLTVTKDALEYFTGSPKGILERPETLLVLSFAQLQQLGIHAHFTKAFTFDMDLLRLIDQLHDFTTQHKVSIVVKHLQNIVVAVDGQVSTTKLFTDLQPWRVCTAAHAAVWWLQNPNRPFEALSSSVL